jgi:hypothetical protein
MRVALCLSGQPRCALKTFPYIYENIIQPNNADVFIHMNYDEDTLYIEKNHLDNGNCILEKGIDKKVIELYNPIRYLVEKPKNMFKPNLIFTEKRLHNIMEMNKHRNMTKEETASHFCKQLLSMYYSIYKSNELKETYANENGFVYDYVIRLRFDCLPHEKIYVMDKNPNFIYYLYLNQPDELISDWINFGSNSIMNIYSSIYLNIEYFNTFLFLKKEDRQDNELDNSDICGGSAEHNLRDLMTLYKIPKQAFYSNLSLIKE